MVGVFFDDAFCMPFAQKLFLLFFELDIDDCTMLVFDHGLEFVLTCTIGREHIGLVFPCLFGDDIHPLCHHEYRVEAHTKLTDQVAVFFGITRKLLHKGLGAGFGDGAEIVHQVLLIHPDAIVVEGDRVVRLIQLDIDLAFPVTFFELLICQSKIVKLVQRITCIGDKLPYENLFV